MVGWSRSFSWLFVAALASGLASWSCVAAAPEPAEAPVGSSVEDSHSPIAYAFESLDARPVSAAALRGKVVVMAFVTTGNLASQAQMNFLIAMAKHDGEQVAYVMAAAEPKANRELIELYRSKLGVTFLAAIVDDETLAGRGGFGELDAVPTTVVLDRRGRAVWKHVGLAKADDIRAALPR